MFNLPFDRFTELPIIKELKKYMVEVMTDQNEINEDTRTQLELINQTLILKNNLFIG